MSPLLKALENKYTGVLMTSTCGHYKLDQHNGHAQMATKDEIDAEITLVNGGRSKTLGKENPDESL
eukprot:2179567-Ditylum_brightwellii.AAC.1